MHDSPRFNDRPRRRHTRPGVKLADALARSIITIGGVSTIAAVLGVCVYLLWVAAPLMWPARSLGTQVVETSWQPVPQRLQVDEHRILGISLAGAGDMGVFQVDDGH